MCIAARIFVTFITLAVMVVGLAGIAKLVHGHEGHDPVSQFYREWMMPANYGIQHRTSSCCNSDDCKVRAIRGAPGQRKVWVEELDQWVDFPEHVLEQNQPDPYESPDGQTHACVMIYDGFPMVRCGVLGVGT